MKTEIQKAPSGRVKRQPIGVRNRLSVQGKDPNYVYRFVNDIGDRIQQFEAAGYERVTKLDHKIGDNRVDVASADGSDAQLSVGYNPRGDIQKAFLMRIKKEWYEEDQAAKLANNKEIESATKKPQIDGGTYGDLKIS